MRRIYLVSYVLLVCSVTSVLAMASVPTSMSVQGRLTDGGGTPLPPGFKQMTFKIYDAQAGGTLIWPGETQFVSSNADGLWNAGVGTVTPLTPLVFADSVRWLEITVDDGINPAETLPRVRLRSAPYVLQAEHAIHADTADVALQSAPDNDWTTTDSILYTTDLRGVLKGNAGNAHFGDSGHTVVNLGYGSSTGAPGLHNQGMSVGGGNRNSAEGPFSTVGGGLQNVARGDYSTVGGGGSNAVQDSNIAAGFGNTIGGGTKNLTDGSNSTISGGWLNTANATHATVGGGAINIASGEHSTVSGGRDNDAVGAHASIGGGFLHYASGDSSTIGGGAGNTASSHSSTISGGRRNSASGNYATVGGGQGNTASGQGAAVAGGSSNSAIQDDAAVGGGIGNTVNGVRSTISGGHFNTVDANYSTISGGQSGIVSGLNSIIGGGRFNRNRGDYSVLCGGGGSTEADSNSVSGDYASIGGGRRNYATGNHAAIPGGYNNIASGSYAFAGGYRAIAENLGSFVWSDGSSANSFTSANMGNNSFSVRAYGGVFFASGDGGILPFTGVALQSGAGAWNNACDRDLKENRRPVDCAEILDRVAQLPISRWNYKTQDASVEHIGPMAQDFHRLFQVGHDSLTISTLDPDGIALAAIQELEMRTRRIDALEAEIAELRRIVSRITAER